ncbi:hypothetical protein [Parasegetibacter sp. NRK P23]|uniref:hypothetical protein n=1 Tax=Parasegetibacter sp. NRK P23 TaxID=2942999 RepID=UPI0020439FB5|nr:hypothetical protein [Parasegetibacter sp. NRK P23]MCM5527927.1 hypothetical protein [Parasegetibacter sp. NRK P23]
MNEIAILLLILFLPPIVTIISGLVLIFSPQKRKSVKRIFLIAAILLGIELLIGFAVCGNMNFH